MSNVTTNNRTEPLQAIEQRLITTFLLNCNLFESYPIDENLFSYPVHKDIFRAMIKLYDKERNIDLEKLLLEFVSDTGTMDYIFKLNDSLDNRAFIENDIKYLDNIYRINAAKKILKENPSDFDVLLGELVSIPSYYKSEINGNLLDPSEIVEIVTKKEDTLRFDVLGFLNYYEINFNTLNVIASRTGKGKTAIALNILMDLSSRYKCLYFNLENNNKTVYQRLVSIGSKLTKHELRRKENLGTVSDVAYKLSNNSNIKLYDMKQVTTWEDIKQIILNETKDSFCIIFIDNVNNLKSVRKFNTKREEIDYYSKQFIELKGKRRCTIFELCQLRRMADESKRPTVNDLKECGSLEEDADNVFLLHDNTNDINILNPHYEIYTSKSRNEQNQKIDLTFYKSYQIFKEKRT